MITQLNISKLIEKSEELVYNGMIDMAAFGEKPIQVLESESSNKYIFKVSMTLINEKEADFYNKL
jgi:hypothetical protein